MTQQARKAKVLKYLAKPSRDGALKERIRHQACDEEAFEKPYTVRALQGPLRAS